MRKKVYTLFNEYPGKISSNIRTMIPRLIEDHVVSSLLSSEKIVLVLGARQVGKTTLVKDISQKLFLGIWFLVGFGFKEYRLSVTSTVVLFLSILVNSLVFAISDYGEMTMFWLLVFLIGSIGTKSTIHSVKSISDSIMNPLKNKIAVMEQRVDKDKMP